MNLQELQMKFVMPPSIKAVKTDAIDSASVAHGFAILCATAATLLRRLPWRYMPEITKSIAAIISERYWIRSQT